VFYYWFLLLCSVRFFDLKFLGELLLTNFTLIGGVSLILFVGCNYLIKGKQTHNHTYSLKLKYLYLAVFTSTLASYYFNGQPFLHSIISSRILYYYLFYEALHIIKPSFKLVRNSIVIISSLYISIFLLQFTIYPIEIVFSGMTADRAKVRIRMPGRAFAFYMALWSLFIVVAKTQVNKAKAIVLWFGSNVTILLAVTRSIILSIVVSQLLLLLKFQRKNILIIAIPAVVIVLLFYLVMDRIDPNLLSNLINVTKENNSEGEDTLRALAFQHFFTDITSRPWAFIFGNGNPTGGENFTSAYALKSKSEGELGFFLDDLGVFGTTYRYGIFYFIFIISMFRTIYKWFYRAEINRKLFHIKYYFIYLFLIGFIIDFFGISTDGIVLVCISFYLMDKYSIMSNSKEHQLSYNI
jgi:hypothetical protein